MEAVTAWCLGSKEAGRIVVGVPEAPTTIQTFQAACQFKLAQAHKMSCVHGSFP